MALKTRLVADHSPGCIGMKCFRDGSWPTPWFLTREVVYRDVTGGRRGHSYRWLVAACNTTSSHPCEAKLLINDESILEAVPPSLQQSDGRQTEAT